MSAVSEAFLTKLPTMPLMPVIIILRDRKDYAFILEDGWKKGQGSMSELEQG